VYGVDQAMKDTKPKQTAVISLHRKKKKKQSKWSNEKSEGMK
jgi:hypothetical protein